MVASDEEHKQVQVADEAPAVPSSDEMEEAEEGEPGPRDLAEEYEEYINSLPMGPITCIFCGECAMVGEENYYGICRYCRHNIHLSVKSVNEFEDLMQEQSLLHGFNCPGEVKFHYLGDYQGTSWVLMTCNQCSITEFI